MKIAHIVSTYPPYFGGMGNAAAGMTRALAERDHDVTVLTLRPRGRATGIPQREATIVQHLRPIVRSGNAGFVPQLFWMLDHYDIVHLHYPFFGGAEIALLWRFSHGRSLRRPRFIMTYHMDAIADGWRGIYFSWQNRTVLPALLARADHVHATSDDYRTHSLLEQYGALIHGRSSAIPLGVDCIRFSPRHRSPALWNTMRISAGAFVYLFVGGFDRAHSFKGIEPLLRAFAFFREAQVKEGTSPPAVLVMAGEGALRPTYEALAGELGISEAVRFVGRVSDDELPRYMATSDALVLPSTSASEAFGMVLLEAMASGTPVIASQLPGVRTLVRDGETGLLERPNDVVGLATALYRMSEDCDRTRAMGVAARAHVEERYSWARVAEELETVYKK